MKIRRATRCIESAAALVIGLGVLFMSCSSDDPTVPPAVPCDEQNPGGFSISNPRPGRVYVWGGTGQPGAGELGRAPGYTTLYWPIKVPDFDPDGKPIVLDKNNHRVLAVDAKEKFEEIIGHGFGNPIDGPALEADLNHPTNVTFSPDGTKLILCAWHNSIVMEEDLATGWIARYCGTGARCYNGDGLARLSSCFDLPVCALFHPITGELYIGDQGNEVIRRIDANGIVHVVAGTVPSFNGTRWDYHIGYAGDGGPATSALLHFERGMTADPSGRFCFDSAGNLYIADTGNHVIRIVHYPDATIDTFAGMGPGAGPGFSGDGGPANEGAVEPAARRCVRRRRRFSLHRRHR